MAIAARSTARGRFALLVIFDELFERICDLEKQWSGEYFNQKVLCIDIVFASSIVGNACTKSWYPRQYAERFDRILFGQIVSAATIHP